MEIKKFNEKFSNENNSFSGDKDKVIDIYIKQYDIDEGFTYRLVVETKSGKKYYIKAKNDSPLSFEED